MTDLRAALAPYRCWDAEVQAVYEARGEAALDVALQNREELLGLCEFIEEHGVRSYLEVGSWTGALVRALHGIFRFDKVAACDDGWCRRFGLTPRLPDGCLSFEGSSRGPAYREWRAALGRFDLVLIDADHHYAGVRADFEINRVFPHRFIAFHDIVGGDPHTAGVARLWRELDGHKREIIRPHVELGRDHSTMGIGVWSAS